jgi:hypothetical protein
MGSGLGIELITVIFPMKKPENPHITRENASNNQEVDFL